MVGIGQTFAFKSRTRQTDYKSQNLHAHRHRQTIHLPYLPLLLFRFLRTVYIFFLLPNYLTKIF